MKEQVTMLTLCIFSGLSAPSALKLKYNNLHWFCSLYMYGGWEPTNQPKTIFRRSTNFLLLTESNISWKCFIFIVTLAHLTWMFVLRNITIFIQDYYHSCAKFLLLLHKICTNFIVTQIRGLSDDTRIHQCQDDCTLGIPLQRSHARDAILLLARLA